ncbi:MAG: glycosyltransferase [Oscillospiraceae bacterium]
MHLIASDKGGAFRAAQRISDSLSLCGVRSDILVLEKKAGIEHTTEYLDDFLKKVIHKARYRFSVIRIKKYGLSGVFYESRLGVDLLSHPLVKNADVIHLHWINDGMVSFRGLKALCSSGKTIVWTLHDMYAFTGGCYYDGGCGGYASACEDCPAVSNISNGREYISSMFKTKMDAYSNISFVGCSRWICSCAEKNPYLKSYKIVNIPNPIYTDRFYPQTDKDRIFKEFHLKNNGKKILLFGAMSSTSDKRKGYEYLVRSLWALNDKNKYRLIVFGNDKNYTLPVDIECECVGTVYDDKRLADLYSIADVFIAPSLQENLSNAVMEALACGTPVAAFDIGGMGDMITHKSSGYLAASFDTDDLARGIEFCAMESHNMSEYCTRTVNERFALDKIGRMYLEHYQSRYHD